MKHFVLDRQMDYVSMTASFYTPLNNGSNCALSAELIFQSEEGEELLKLDSDIKFCSYTAGEWSDIRMYNAIPEKIRKDVRRIQLNVRYWGLVGGSH